MRFDGPTLAHAWLSVAQASASKDDNAAFSRTVAIEEFPSGIRLVATDRFVLLTAWVPELDAHYHHEPSLEEAPDRTVIAWDHDGRGKHLLGYVMTLASRLDLTELPPGKLEVRIDFDVRLPVDQAGNETLAGLEPVFTVLSVPDTEKVYLPVVEATYPAWRTMVVDHRPRSTDAIALSPELVERVAKVRRWSDGPLVWRFGGADRVAAVDFPESDPHVSGLVMPRRWVLEGEAPDADDEPLPPTDDDGAA